MDMTQALTEIAALQGKLKSANDEAKGHRLNAESFRAQAEEFRTKLTETAASIEDLKKTYAEEAEKMRLDLAGKLSAAEQGAAAIAAAAKSKVMMADLKLAARDHGLVDLDCLKLIDLAGVKADAEGHATNAADVLAAMKEIKPYLFGEALKPGTVTGNTSSTFRAPATASAKTHFDARAASKEDYEAAKKAQLGHIRR